MADHRFQYECSMGHQLFSHKPLTACLVARCQGVLKRIGPGSRTKEQTDGS